MERIETWADFCQAIGSFAGAARPLEAMAQAGFELGGTVADAFNVGSAFPASDPSVLGRLKQAFGNPPPTRLHVGSAPVAVQRRAGNYSATASLDLAIVNEILAELWRVGTIPQQLSIADTSKIFSLEELRLWSAKRLAERKSQAGKVRNVQS